GTAFVGKAPEVQFANWIRCGAAGRKSGVIARAFSLDEEWTALRTKAARRPWLRAIEENEADLPLFSAARTAESPAVPETVRDLVGNAAGTLQTLEASGIKVGQGLRTGCNRFFYVNTAGPVRNDTAPIRVSAAYGGCEFNVPAEVLRPVLRKQVEVPIVER